MTAQRIEYEFPDKAGFLFKPSRYKVFYGGRDSGKSWSVARALLLLGAERPLRVGCFREIQKDLSESSLQLLKDQIPKLGLSGFYRILKSEINAPNGTSFKFDGLANHNKDSIKSYEGLDIAWIEEANKTSEGSWDVLEPTVRKPGSELWLTFNPEMDTDYVYKLFVANTPPTDATVVKANWYDNPWRSSVLDASRERMQKEDPEKYTYVYEGNCRPAVEGAIYYKEVSRLRSEGRLHAVPYDPMLKVHLVADLGYNDFTSFLLVQKLASEIRVIRYLEDRQRYIPSYSQELKELKLNWGTMYLPHDAKAKHLTGASAEEQFRALGWTVEVLPDIGVENGIRKAREIFPRVHIDKENASELVTRLGRYRRRVNTEGQASTPMHDDESHGADGFRYMAQCVGQMTNDTDAGWGRKIVYSNQGIV